MGLDQLHRLFTKEDHIGPIKNVHKILGILCLIHFIFRLRPGTVLLPIPFTFILMTAHELLSMISLIFKVPYKRVIGSTVIWKEMQLHNIIFTSRGYFIFIMLYYGIKDPIYKLPVIICCHFMADIVSYFYGDPNGGTTIRGTDRSRRFKNVKYLEHLESLGIYISCASQIYAVYILIAFDNMLYPLMTLIPIQISTFLGTLVRKGIMSSKINNILYLFCIIVPIYIHYKWTVYCLPIVLTLSFIRFKVIGNCKYQQFYKYIMWISFALFYQKYIYISETINI
jgi:hypothetical protein